VKAALGHKRADAAARPQLLKLGKSDTLATHPGYVSHGVWLYYRFCLSYRDVEVVQLGPQNLG
jgi:hypothetical protein